MVFEPRFRMGPPPRSFAADAHDCIMVPILADRPNTSLWRDGAPDGELPSVVMFANTEPLGKICLNRGSPIREFGLVRPNKSAALLGTVKGTSLRDGLRPPLTVPAPSGPSQPVGTRRWSPAHQTRRWNDPRSALTLSAPYKSFGRYVAIQSNASNLVPDDTNGTTDVFVFDRKTDTTERVSAASDGTDANAGSASWGSAISANGRYVTYQSHASNLVPGDANDAQDVFVVPRYDWLG